MREDTRQPAAWWLLAVALMGIASCGPAGRHSDGAAEGQGEDHGEEEGVVALSAAALQRVGLTTARVELRGLPGTLSTTGKVGFDERRIAHLSPRLAGQVQRVEAELGQSVVAGSPLAWIDSIELGRAKADYLRARARYELAQRRHQRERLLYEDRISSEQEVLEAEAGAREAQADLAAAEETLHLYGLDQEEVAGLDYDDPRASLYAVRAPFAGKVVGKGVARGELVTPERTLFTVADLDTAWVWLDVYERDLRHVALGQAVQVEVDAYPGELFEGTIGYLGDMVEPESRTVRGRVELRNPGGRLRPGMFARVEMSDPEAAAAAAPVPAVPQAALQRQGDGAVVFVALGEGRFERRPVQVGRRSFGWVEVLVGLEAGEEVVTEGAFLLKSQASENQLGGHHH